MAVYFFIQQLNNQSVKNFASNFMSAGCLQDLKTGDGIFRSPDSKLFVFWIYRWNVWRNETHNMDLLPPAAVQVDRDLKL